MYRETYSVPYLPTLSYLTCYGTWPCPFDVSCPRYCLYLFLPTYLSRRPSFLFFLTLRTLTPTRNPARLVFAHPHPDFSALTRGTREFSLRFTPPNAPVTPGPIPASTHPTFIDGCFLVAATATSHLPALAASANLDFLPPHARAFYPQPASFLSRREIRRTLDCSGCFILHGASDPPPFRLMDHHHLAHSRHFLLSGDN